MAKKNTAAIAEELAAPILEEMGLQLWDVVYEKEGSGWYLRYYVDKEGGIDINSCEAIGLGDHGVLLSTDGRTRRAHNGRQLLPVDRRVPKTRGRTRTIANAPGRPSSPVKFEPLPEMRCDALPTLSLGFRCYLEGRAVSQSPDHVRRHLIALCLPSQHADEPV